MNLRRLTFSRAALVENDEEGCAYFLRPELAWNEDAGDLAEDGRTVHGALAKVTTRVQHAPPADRTLRAMYSYARAWMRQAGLFAYDGQPRADLCAERAFAYDTATGAGRALEDPAGAPPRWYADPVWRASYAGPGGPVRDTEICGRLDLVAVGMDDEGPYLFVADYKCHFGPEGSEARAQLAVGALAAARAWNLDRARAVGVHLWADREALEEPYAFESKDLRAIARRLADLAAGPAPALPHEGPWCREHYCPARASCPVALEAVGELEALIPTEALARRATLARDAETDEDADSQLVAMDLVLELLKARRKALEVLADARGGIVRKSGKVWSGKPQTNETPDLMVPGALEVLEEAGLYFAVEVSTSWAAITEVASAEKAEAMREALRAIGALKSSTFTKYQDRKPPGLVKAKATKARKAS